MVEVTREQVDKLSFGEALNSTQKRYGRGATSLKPIELNEKTRSEVERELTQINAELTHAGSASSEALNVRKTLLEHALENGSVVHANDLAGALILTHGVENALPILRRLREVKVNARKESHLAGYQGGLPAIIDALRKTPSGRYITDLDSHLQNNPRAIVTSELAKVTKARSAQVITASAVLESMGRIVKHPFGKERAWTHKEHALNGREAFARTIFWNVLNELSNTPKKAIHIHDTTGVDPKQVLSVIRALHAAGLVKEGEKQNGTPYTLTTKGKQLKSQMKKGEYPDELRLIALGEYAPGVTHSRSIVLQSVHDNIKLVAHVLWLRHQGASVESINRKLPQASTRVITNIIAGMRPWRKMGDALTAKHYDKLKSEAKPGEPDLASFFLKERNRNKQGDFTDPVHHANIIKCAIALNALQQAGNRVKKAAAQLAIDATYLRKVQIGRRAWNLVPSTHLPKHLEKLEKSNVPNAKQLVQVIKEDLKKIKK